MKSMPMGAFVYAQFKLLLHAALENGEWWHSSVGMLQHSVTNYLKFHIWHPKLRGPDIDENGLIHSHKFEMTSYVLHGVLRQNIWDISSDRGTYSIYNYKDNKLELSMSSVSPVKVDSYVVPASELYSQRPYMLHTTDIDKLCITAVSWGGNWGRHSVAAKGNKLSQTVLTITDAEKQKFLNETKETLSKKA